MKTTLEIPDSIFKKAKAKAAEQGVPLRQFITEAVEARLKLCTSQTKPWMQVIGGLKHLKKENARIDKIIEEEFEQIDPGDWN
jgi:hypothetical protein